MLRFIATKLKSEGGINCEVKYEDIWPDWVFNDIWQKFDGKQFESEMFVISRKGCVSTCRCVPYGLMKVLNHGRNVVILSTKGNKAKIVDTSLYYNHENNRFHLKSLVDIRPYGGTHWTRKNRPVYRGGGNNTNEVDECNVKDEPKLEPKWE